MAKNDEDMVKVDPIERLKAEHRIWNICHPKGFEANPVATEDGHEDWLIWRCVIPGPRKTPWEHGRFKLMIYYSNEYPDQPPKCQFQPTLLHPNIFPSGTVALSLLDCDWKPTLTIKDILPGIQWLLKEPNMTNPAHAIAYTLCKNSLMEYNSRIKRLAANSTKTT